jgi:DNA-directed RNA polymerase subunit RPC12/RpoP
MIGMMKDRLRNFMIGRYGVDQFNRFLLILAVVNIMIGMFTHNWILNSITILLLVFSYYRMFSKDFSRRSRENNWYLKYENKFGGSYNKFVNTMRQRRVYHIYKCPTCKQKIRIPKGKGRISITCPKCRTDFVKKS